MRKLRLSIVEGPDEGFRCEFQQRRVIVGSDFGSDLVLAHAGIEPRHILMEDEGGEICVEDLTARGDAKLNGEALRRVVLHDGDELQVGPYVFHVSIEADLTLAQEQRPRPAGKPLSDRFRILRQPPVLALLTLFAIVIIYLSISSMTEEKPGEDMSALGPVPLPAEGIYGCKVKGKSYVDKAEFTFVANGPKYRIQYYPGYIDRPGLVQVFVNEKRLGSVPPTYDRWSDEAVSIEIPEQLLKVGEPNVVRFDNARNPPEVSRWGVRDVSALEVPVLKCDVEVAKKYLTLAKKKYDEKEIAEANLYDAIKYLKEGQEYVIACKDTPVKGELHDAMRIYSEDLDGIFSRMMFNTRKCLKLKDLDSAKFELERVLLYFPDTSDPRHRKAQDILEELKRNTP